MNATLVSAGSTMRTSNKKDEGNVFASSLRDAGGPSISVLTKFVCVITLVNSDRKSWYLFVLVMLFVGLVIVWLFYTTWKQHKSLASIADDFNRVISAPLDENEGPASTTAPAATQSAEPQVELTQSSFDASTRIISGPSSDEV